MPYLQEAHKVQIAISATRENAQQYAAELDQDAAAEAARPAEHA